MRFLADESCDFAVVRALRASGYDITAVSEITPRAKDSNVISLAVREERILLTEDKDFGRLVYAHGQKTLGVIFLRYPNSARKQISKDVVKFVKQQRERLIGCFNTIQPGRIRIHQPPSNKT
jgi:predicted nuclease of predicted toxin-antitoxin system